MPLKGSAAASSRDHTQTGSRMIPCFRAWACRPLAAILILAAAGLHWAYLTHECPLDLAPDEAHYWDWSRQPDWCYYSKGPLVAWLIGASGWLAISLSYIPSATSSGSSYQRLRSPILARSFQARDFGSSSIRAMRASTRSSSVARFGMS